MSAEGGYPGATTTGFWWNDKWVEVKPSHGDDDGPPSGVRETRRPRPKAPAGAAALTVEKEQDREYVTA